MQTQLTMYRALIRPLLEYGVTVLDSTKAVHKYKLDVIQAKTLRITCGAMGITPISALLIETDEKPLQLATEQQEIKYALKMNVPDNHVARAMLEDLWTVFRAKSNK